MDTKHPSGCHEQPRAEERIVAAAASEFATKGYFGARTQAIADAAGVNKAMLHYYFRSKDNLHAKVIQTAFKDIWKQVGTAWLDSGSLEERLNRVVDVYMDNYTRNPGFIKILLREVLEGGERLRDALGAVRFEELWGLGLTPARMTARVGDELGVTPAEATHLILNLIGMCLVGFVSPPFLEALVDLDLSDFDAYLGNRRAAVKTMLRAYVRSRSQTTAGGET